MYRNQLEGGRAVPPEPSKQLKRGSFLRRAALALLVPVAGLGVLLAFAVGGREAGAYQAYLDGCDNCHGGFRVNPYVSTKGGTWPDSLHNVHRNAGRMATTCDACHNSADFGNPSLASSDIDACNNAPGKGCLGCHGQPDAGGVLRGYGLRARHAAGGVTTCANAGCHTSDGPPMPESTVPPNYGCTGTKANNPCIDPAGTGTEDWSGDGAGLDNDGDTLYDMNDPDCSGVAPDRDGDTVPDATDNCPDDPNANQADLDGDTIGDVCDPDADGDGDPATTDCDDLNPNRAHSIPENCTNGIDDDCDTLTDAADPDCAPPDRDGDTIPDATDNCPDTPNPNQADLDGDTIGDVCDPDADGDGDPAVTDCDDLDPNRAHSIPENCTNGIDDDCDNLTDALDPDCAGPCTDLDGDGYGDPPSPGCPNGNIQDCDDANGQVWQTPAEAAMLLWTSKTAFGWNDLALQAGTAIEYQILRGRLDQFPVGSPGAETCLGTVQTNAFTDPTPAGGEYFWYLVRGKNACANGTGIWGSDSNGTEETSAVCP